MASPRLLSTDFDGTLIGHPSRIQCPDALSELLVSHHQNGGIWAVNTGRGLEHILEGLDLFAAPVPPDYLLVNEREIHRRSGSGWAAQEEWNLRCRQQHRQLELRSERIYSAMRGLAAASPDAVSLIFEGSEAPAGLVTRDEEVMEDVAEKLDKLLGQGSDFAYQRNAIYLRFCHRAYHKGASLAELCRLENLGSEEVLAVGDHYNDLSMLDGVSAQMTACPANAIDAVKEAVRKSGGYLAELPWAEGVAEALCYFKKVSEDAPEEERSQRRESTDG